MAQTYYTLEEAAEKLGIAVPEFKKRLRTEWTYIRPLQDGSTQRFKSKDVEELARQIGFGSEEELQLVDPSSDEIGVPLELKAADGPPSRSSKPPSSKTKMAPVKHDDDDVIPLTEDDLNLADQDVFLLADDEAGPQSKKSNSKLKPEPPKKSDSDVRLMQSGKIKRPTIEEPSDEIELDILPNIGSSTRLGGPAKSSKGSGKLSSKSSGKLSSSKAGKPPAEVEHGSSEFELSLDADSSDEFELSLADDSSDEISLGVLPPSKSSDSKAGLASGINIGRPKDAGLSLEKKGVGPSSRKLPPVKLESLAGRSSKKMPAVKLPPDDSSDEIDFELNLDQPGASSKKIASSKKLIEAENSEFDLSLDDSASDLGIHLDDSTTSLPAHAGHDEKKNDIFETDFEIPALDDDSASEAVAIDEADTDLENSDFDLAIDEPSDVSVEDDSGSQVVVLDDETELPAPKKPAKRKKKAVEMDEDADVEISDDAVSFDEMDLDEGESASKALKGVRHDDVEDEDEAERTVVVSGAPWGVFPALVLLPTVFIMFVGGLMAYEMMHSMWGYHQPTKPSSLVIDQVADMLDMKAKDEVAGR